MIGLGTDKNQSPTEPNTITILKPVCWSIVLLEGKCYCCLSAPGCSATPLLGPAIGHASMWWQQWLLYIVTRACTPSLPTPALIIGHALNPEREYLTSGEPVGLAANLSIITFCHFVTVSMFNRTIIRIKTMRSTCSPTLESSWSCHQSVTSHWRVDVAGQWRLILDIFHLPRSTSANQGLPSFLSHYIPNYLWSFWVWVPKKCNITASVNATLIANEVIG